MRTSVFRYLAPALGAASPEQCPIDATLAGEATWGAQLEEHWDTLMSVSQIPPQSFVWTMLGMMGIFKGDISLSCLTPDKDCSYAGSSCTPSDLS